MVDFTRRKKEIKVRDIGVILSVCIVLGALFASHNWTSYAVALQRKS